MKCKKAKKEISAYLDDELAPDEKEAFALHVRDCAACREKLEEIRAVSHMFAGAERFSAPYGFATRILASIEEREAPWPRRIPRLGLFLSRVAGVAFALVIILVGLISGNLLVTHRTSPATRASMQESFSLDLFQATPPGSIGDLYVSLMGAGDER